MRSTLPLLFCLLVACGDAPIASTSSSSGSAGSVSDHGHSHDEVSIGTIQIGGRDVTLLQGHGVVRAGVESHLVVQFEEASAGTSTVRAWLGTQDRNASFVGKGEYDAAHKTYNVHATAPDPLPDGVMWWLEIEDADGRKALGNAKPIL